MASAVTIDTIVGAGKVVFSILDQKTLCVFNDVVKLNIEARKP